MRLIKATGDAVMLVALAALDAGPIVETALELVERTSETTATDFPRLRAGMACGTALNRSGDWYGTPVKLASRVTAAAPAGSVLCSGDVREAAGDSYRWTAFGAQRFRGIEGEVELFRPSADLTHPEAVKRPSRLTLSLSSASLLDAMSDELPLAECRLDLPGLRAQRDRYRRLADSVRRLERQPDRLVVEFGDDLDSPLLDETLTVERVCCPFFRLEFVPNERRLIAKVEHSHQEPALDALRLQLSRPET